MKFIVMWVLPMLRSTPSKPAFCARSAASMYFRVISSISGMVSGRIMSRWKSLGRGMLTAEAPMGGPSYVAGWLGNSGFCQGPSCSICMNVGQPWLWMRSTSCVIPGMYLSSSMR